MGLFGKKVEQTPAQTSPALDVKQIEAALNQVVANMKKSYEAINSRLDKMQSEIEGSFVAVGEDFESLSRDVGVLKSIVSSGEADEDFEAPKPKAMYKRVTSNDVRNFESEKEKKKALLRKR
jgi:hypothetical protein